MSGFIQSNQIVKLPYANTAINVADSGKIFITPQTVGAAAVIYTLPTVAEGFHQWGQSSIEWLSSNQYKCSGCYSKR